MNFQLPGSDLEDRMEISDYLIDLSVKRKIKFKIQLFEYIFKKTN